MHIRISIRESIVSKPLINKTKFKEDFIMLDEAKHPFLELGDVDAPPNKTLIMIGGIPTNPMESMTWLADCLNQIDSSLRIIIFNMPFYNQYFSIEYSNQFAKSNGESLRAICKDESMPCRSNVFRWLLSDSKLYEGFRDQYALARQIQAECLFDDINEIADKESQTPLVVEGKLIYDENGKPVMITDMVGINHAKLRIDSRKWTVSRLLPRKYGDKADGADSEDNNQPIGKVQIEVVGAQLKD